jgi:hypothetical protein
VKPETRNRSLEQKGQAIPVATRGLTGTGPGLAPQESAGLVFGRVWNRTDPFLRSKPRPLAGCPDPLLTLIRWAARLNPGPGPQLARTINELTRALCAHCIEAAIHCVPGQLGISGNEVADRQVNNARNGRGDTVHEQIYFSSRNRAWRNSESRKAANAVWDANHWLKNYGYRLKGKAGSKRSVPMTSVSSLATTFYTLKSGHALVGR